VSDLVRSLVSKTSALRGMSVQIRPMALKARSVGARTGLCKWPDVVVPTESKDRDKRQPRYRENRVQEVLRFDAVKSDGVPTE
jgi:hypothetical protein